MTTNNGRLIAIGDVHGCAHALDALLDALVPAAEDQLVFLGDLVDQGKESREVLNRIGQLQQECRVVIIQGNHEEMMFAALENEQALRYWERCGGVPTLNSYRFGATLADIPERHWVLLASGQPYFETEEFIFTHANYLPDLPMAEQPGYQLRWATFETDKEQPHFSGKRVIVGHTEQKNAEIRDLGFTTCIDTACWKYGWLTAIELPTKRLWQASRWGVLREVDETSHREQLTPLLRPGTSWPYPSVTADR